MHFQPTRRPVTPRGKREIRGSSDLLCPVCQSFLSEHDLTPQPIIKQGGRVTGDGEEQETLLVDL